MRLLDLGTVPWLQSQSIHHAVAQVFDADTPDTLVLVRPDRSYLCVGPHHVGAPLSAAAVRQRGLPVVRRRLGGGTVMVTAEQTFFVLIAHRRRMPLPSPQAQAWCLGAGVAAYRRLGVDAALNGMEIQWQGRKLCGAGAASIGEASVFGGNVIHRFDAAPFVDVLRLPSQDSRAVLLDEVAAQMGSVEHATGRLPSPGAVARALRDGVTEACGVELVPGRLTPRERAAVGPAERWLSRVDLRRAGPGVVSSWKVRSGSCVVAVRLRQPWRAGALVIVRDHRVAAVVADGRPHRAALEGLRGLLVAAATDSLDALRDRAEPYRVEGGEPLLSWLTGALRLVT